MSLADKAHIYPPTMKESIHDVLLTPFMVRVREAVTGGDSSATLVFERSRPELIAVAIDEWFNLRTSAEHAMAEANSMLHEADRITLDDEFGTGTLSFTMRWRDRSVRVAVGRDDLHSGHVVTESMVFQPPESDEVRPGNDTFIEELMVSLVGISLPDIKFNEEHNNE